MDSSLLKGKTVVITGASSGIGKALAIELAKLGAKVGLISRSEEKLKDIVDSITAKGGTAAYAAADVAVPDQLQRAFGSLETVLGTINALINNAGITDVNPINVEELNKVVDVNVKGPLFAAALIKPFLAKAGGGVILNTSSIASIPPWDSAPVYSCTKAALNRFTTVTKPSFDALKIRMNAIMPCFIDTPMLDLFPKNIRDLGLKMTGMDLLHPEDLVPFYAFFLADAGKRVDKKIIDVLLFYKALNFINTLPEDQSREWPDLEPVLKKGVEPEVFQHVAENAKLFKFILSNR